ncbi:MAG: peptidylprolyl isomerase [Acidobacteriota bacterium]
MRRAAADALVALDRPRPRLGPIGGGRASVQPFRNVVLQTLRPPRVRVETTAGVFHVALTCDAAPRTCVNWMQLVRQGFYDGLRIHRAVPGFVVQAGDPRGDGAGGPGYRIRDEGNLLPFWRGTVGMARAEPDTAGSQFFVTLDRAPHLDGAYTAFGRVPEADWPVLDRLTEDDRILGAVVLPSGR